MINRRNFTRLAGATGLASPLLGLRQAAAQPAGALTAEAVTAWLKAYGEAWETKNSDLVVSIFAPDAAYRDSAFVPPMVGSDAIRNYWDTTVAGQTDISFTSELWSVVDNVGIAHWAAEFTGVPGGEKAKLDGVFHLTFDTSGAEPVCTQLHEWWLYGA